MYSMPKLWMLADHDMIHESYRFRCVLCILCKNKTRCCWGTFFQCTFFCASAFLLYLVLYLLIYLFLYLLPCLFISHLWSNENVMVEWKLPPYLTCWMDRETSAASVLFLSFLYSLWLWFTITYQHILSIISKQLCRIWTKPLNPKVSTQIFNLLYIS